jgi:HEAT repeat protein
LQKHGVQLTVPALVQALKSSDTEVRNLAAVKLAWDHVKKAVPAIRDALRSERVPMTRVNLAYSLAYLGEAQGFDSLRDLCINPDWPFYLKTISARYMLDLKREDKKCRDALVEVLQSGEGGADSLAETVSLLLRFHNLTPEQPQQMFQIAVKALSSPSAGMRMVASIAIVQIGKSAAIPYLQNAISREEETNTRSVMQRELGRLQSDGKRPD